jgi:hypothetical protein
VLYAEIQLANNNNNNSYVHLVLSMCGEERGKLYLAGSLDVDNCPPLALPPSIPSLPGGEKKLELVSHSWHCSLWTPSIWEFRLEKIKMTHLQ